MGRSFEEPADARDPEAAAARAAGLRIVDLCTERLRMEFGDIGAVVYLLRKVIWTVPDFTVDAYGDQLRRLHDRIRQDGPLVVHSTRTLIEAVEPRPPSRVSRGVRQPTDPVP